MKKKLLMNAIGGINDSHIVEFADVKPQKKSAALWVKIVSAAACLALVMIAIPVLNSLINKPNGNVSALPCITIKDTFYIIDPEYPDSLTAELPAGYVVIGTVESNDSSHKEINGYSQGCKIGEQIYQNPNLPDEVYVYTTLFSGSNEYRYIRFVRFEGDTENQN